ADRRCRALRVAARRPRVPQADVADRVLARGGARSRRRDRGARRVRGSRRARAPGSQADGHAASDHGRGPRAARVPEPLRATAAYHVPQPPEVRAKLDANELPYPLPAELRARLGAALAEVAIERYPDPSARELRAL